MNKSRVVGKVRFENADVRLVISRLVITERLNGHKSTDSLE